MRAYLRNIYYSFPVQLLLLHFRRYQVLLVFWYILILAINSHFMKSYGADALFLAPEYLGSVNALGAAIVGVSVGIFMMSWNITTFILHSHRCKFLATTTKPFLKYCLNNSIIPIFFLLYYFVRAFQFDTNRELMSVGEFLTIAAGFAGGFLLLITFSYMYSFGAEKRIKRNLVPIHDPLHIHPDLEFSVKPRDKYGMNVSYFLSSGFRFRKTRSVSHYSQEFLDTVFKRHHFAAMLSILLAFLFLMIIGFFQDNRIFRVPAAASIILFFAVMIAVMGALTYFLRSWSILFVIGLFTVVDFLYREDIIDPRNKAYGLNYENKDERPGYNMESLLQLCRPEQIAVDKKFMAGILDRWKSKQDSAKPVMIFLNISGGGVRSASFSMNVLQHLDSMLGGKLMKKTFMITGASGGMLAGAYYRELYRQKLKGASINLADVQYAEDISEDLLNPLFSSLIARDLLSPAQKFSIGSYRYVKDRGYAFEQQLNDNTNKLLDRSIKDYQAEEAAGEIPLMIFNSVVTRDGRKMMIGAQPISFLMQTPKPSYDSTSLISPDAVDFGAMFSAQDPYNLRLLTALRMNATFPYVLPNVWLPSTPVVDVMDAGLRDNFGQETALRFIHNFRDWINENTSGVLIIQIRDTRKGGWDQPFETNAISGVLTKPATILQYNWYKLQDYFQTDQLAYLESSMPRLRHLSFMYFPEEYDKGATLNFHLTAREKKEVHASLSRGSNVKAFDAVKELVK